LPKLCGQAECEMEKFWAKKLLNDGNLKNGGLEEFWYFDNYQKLYDSENALAHLDNFDEISILGSGSMPLTAYFIVKNNPDVKIKCVDYDPESCALAGKLMKALGIEKNVEIIQCNALDYKPTQGELVICASLMDDKQALYKSLLKQNVTSLLVRDAEDIYQLLYKPAEKPPAAFHKIGKTMPNAEIINTSILYAANGNIKNVKK
ncbi:MAG: hypothetical protein KUG81_08350, partial [Gammaproteobacteria bacterium]|nr:hypothetical protein [Gammaproteobacteria bacterium]